MLAETLAQHVPKKNCCQRDNLQVQLEHDPFWGYGVSVIWSLAHSKHGHGTCWGGALQIRWCHSTTKKMAEFSCVILQGIRCTHEDENPPGVNNCCGPCSLLMSRCWWWWWRWRRRKLYWCWWWTCWCGSNDDVKTMITPMLAKPIFLQSVYTAPHNPAVSRSKRFFADPKEWVSGL